MASGEHYSDETKEDMRRLFKTRDVNGDGVLQVDELEQCLFLMGVNPTCEDLEFLIKHFDTNRDGQLQIEELVENLDVIYSHSMYSEELMDAFSALDTNNDGFLRYTELQKILTHNGYMSGEEASKLISEIAKDFDKNGDGKLSYAEFIPMFLSRQSMKDKVVGALTQNT